MVKSSFIVSLWVDEPSIRLLLTQATSISFLKILMKLPITLSKKGKTVSKKTISLAERCSQSSKQKACRSHSHIFLRWGSAST